MSTYQSLCQAVSDPVLSQDQYVNFPFDREDMIYGKTYFNFRLYPDYMIVDVLICDNYANDFRVVGYYQDGKVAFPTFTGKYLVIDTDHLSLVIPPRNSSKKVLRILLYELASVVGHLYMVPARPEVDDRYGYLDVDESTANEVLSTLYSVLPNLKQPSSVGQLIKLVDKIDTNSWNKINCAALKVFKCWREKWVFKSTNPVLFLPYKYYSNQYPEFFDYVDKVVYLKDFTNTGAFAPNVVLTHKDLGGVLNTVLVDFFSFLCDVSNKMFLEFSTSDKNYIMKLDNLMAEISDVLVDKIAMGGGD